ncbi:MAG TPA: phosphohistidine phosphatase SixA [Planctomycetota bacterium]|nr:phosphohistidine phosphatase SixA [Planctomycetota bacterium]
MHLYIMRHGIAFEPSEWQGTDTTRPLTEKGKKRTRQVLDALLREKKLHVDTLWSSPLVRAWQTAEIAGDALGLKPKQIDELACGASLRSMQKILSALKTSPERLMCVGHEPDCGIIIGQLCGDPETDYALKKAGIAYLEGSYKPGGMKLKWLLAPRDVLKDE